MIRTILAVAAAWLVAVIVMTVFQSLAMMLPIDPMNLNSTMVKLSMALELFGDLVGAVAGGYLAAWIAVDRPMRALWITTLFMMALQLAVLLLPHKDPLTLVAQLSLFFIPIGVLLGGKIRLELVKKSNRESGANQA